MIYVVKNDEKEKTYDVFFDTDELISLRDEIIKKCFYLSKGKFKTNIYCSEECNPRSQYIRHYPLFPNGDFIYTSISNYSSEPISSIYNNYNVIYIEGIKKTVPKLVYILDNIIKSESEILSNDLFEYVNSDELISNINNQHINNFDTQLLREYYSKALSLIKMRLLYEKIYHLNNKYFTAKEFEKTRRNLI